jgi:hypothetical protein
VGRKIITSTEKTIIVEASFGLPPIFFDSFRCSGCMAIARIRLHKMMLTKGYIIARHHPTIKIRKNSRMVVSYTELFVN